MIFLVSLLVHESPDVVNDQIKNFLYFNKSSIIVLHVSKSFFIKNNLSSIIINDRVYVNPIHLDTQWGDLIQPHIENFIYASSFLRFDYFVMHSSNDMYLKFGAEEYMSKFCAGFNLHYLLSDKSFWSHNKFARDDFQLNTILRKYSIPTRIASQVEGSFYKFDVFKKIADIILKNVNFSYDYDSSRYPREEVYFPTIAQLFLNVNTIASPFVFSEVRSIDKIYWKKLKKIDDFKKSFLGKFIPFFLYDKLKNRCFRHARRHPEVRCNISTVNELLKPNLNFIDKFRFLDDGVVNFKLYDKDNLFAVKRVPRDYNNSLRVYIRSLMES